ncbi:MAG: type II 3-dehydroquinate dehydratase [Hyphomicrobiaceae bacterium]|nr:type II 3-dehydroquinate dehydratase [Hyphomicrobiaceae bacterium]
MPKLLLIQGANLSWLGKREPEIYGKTTAAELDAMLFAEAERRQVGLEIRYSNIEGEAINWIYEAADSDVDGLLMNPAGFSLAGYSMMHCLKAVHASLPYIEIHITNIDKRGLWSVTAEAAEGVVSGFGIDSYFVALDAMLRLLARRSNTTGG